MEVLYELNEIIQGKGLMEGEGLIKLQTVYTEGKDKALRIRKYR